ncbi:MAG: DNA-binding MarR family transcriptional regulator [Myxococcota bacterium]|jgi:DNA-binding MarR family transcriptional regulator
MSILGANLDKRVRKMQSDTFLGFAQIAGLAERRALRLFEEHGIFDITPTQSRVLVILFQEQRPLTASEISAHMGLTEVTVGRFIRALRTAGWLTRSQNPDDRRSWLLHPTQRARDNLPTFISVSNALLDAVFATLDPAELELLADAVARMQGGLTDP